MSNNCQYDVLMNTEATEVHLSYCPMIDGWWCVHLTIVDKFTGRRYHYGWKRDRNNNRYWEPLRDTNPGWVNELFLEWAWIYLGNVFDCKSSIYLYS
jgi:hypothetical protein